MKIVSSSPQHEPLVRRKAAGKNGSQSPKPEANTQGASPRLQAPGSRAAQTYQSRASLSSEFDRPSQQKTQQQTDDKSGPGFYRFKSADEFPSRTQRALGAYQSNQNSLPLPGKGASVEVKSNIDTFV